MNVSVFSKLVQRHHRALAVAALALPIVAGWANSARADLVCTPLQVSSIELREAVRVGNGFEFKVHAVTRNTNRTVAYGGHTETQMTLYMIRDFAPAGQPRSSTLLTFKYGFPIQANGAIPHNSGKVTAMRDPNQLDKTEVEVIGTVFNAQCPSGKQVTASKFRFDLTPVLQGKPPRRVSARLTGYTEGVRPRPGSGAPAPRS